MRSYYRYGFECEICEDKNEYDVKINSGTYQSMKNFCKTFLWRKQPYLHDHLNANIYKARINDDDVEVMNVFRETKFEDPLTPDLDEWMFEVKYNAECMETMIGKDGRKIKKVNVKKVSIF